jgi:hypothetical protein
MRKEIKIKTLNVHLYGTIGLIIVLLVIFGTLIACSLLFELRPHHFVNTMLAKYEWLRAMRYPSAIILVLILWFSYCIYNRYGDELFENDCTFWFEENHLTIIPGNNPAVDIDYENIVSVKCLEKEPVFLQSRWLYLRLSTRSYYRLIIQGEHNTYKINTRIKLGGENPLIILLLDQLRARCGSEKIEGITYLLKI